MHSHLNMLLAILAAYLLGSVSFALVASRIFGLADPRTYGSKNPGATNVLRSGHKGAAVLTLIGDAAKGWLAVFLAERWAPVFNLPDFTVGLGPIQYQSSVREWEVMVELNIPLQQSSRRSQEREAEALLAAARARRDAGANQALADLAENLAGIDAARRSEALATDDLLPAAELTFKAALAGYETGKLDFATLLDAQRQIRQARQERIKAQAEGQARLAEIERLVGEDL